MPSEEADKQTYRQTETQAEENDKEEMDSQAAEEEPAARVERDTGIDTEMVLRLIL